MSTPTADAFVLHPRLHADTLPVAELPLCRLLLMNDTHYPWLILVPRLMAEHGENSVSPEASQAKYLRDLSDVPAALQPQLWHEITTVEAALKKATLAHKMNTAALANVAQQLHIHVIARFNADAAWPDPVWGKHPATPYQPSAAGQLISRVKTALQELDAAPKTP